MGQHTNLVDPVSDLDIIAWQQNLLRTNLQHRKHKSHHRRTSTRPTTDSKRYKRCHHCHYSLKDHTSSSSSSFRPNEEWLCTHRHINDTSYSKRYIKDFKARNPGAKTTYKDILKYLAQCRKHNVSEAEQTARVKALVEENEILKAVEQEREEAKYNERLKEEKRAKRSEKRVKKEKEDKLVRLVRELAENNRVAMSQGEKVTMTEKEFERAVRNEVALIKAMIEAGERENRGGRQEGGIGMQKQRRIKEKDRREKKIEKGMSRTAAVWGANIPSSGKVEEKMRKDYGTRREENGNESGGREDEEEGDVRGAGKAEDRVCGGG